MAKKKPTTVLSAKVLRFTAFGAMCAVASLFLGIKTAGDVHPFSRSEAAIELPAQGQTSTVKGDVNGNGTLDLEDVIRILEYSQSLATPSPAILSRGDVDGDFLLTEKDALRILRTLAVR